MANPLIVDQRMPCLKDKGLLVLQEELHGQS